MVMMVRGVDRRTVLGGSMALSLAGPGLARTSTRAEAPKPWGAFPSARQLAWHHREMYAFIHFTVNTFTDKEWGYGDEDPKIFNPTDFDADQIVAACKAGNLHGLVLTAKHHDGFCLWPTPLTEHCIRNSPYKNGKGDMVREFADACARGGIAFGVYLSPWDRNHPEYGRPAYIDYFRAQLTDLCTNYGSLYEVWFDGANGGDGYYGGARETRTIDAPKYYDWASVVALVHSLQPMACTFEPFGSDLRWVGNEGGVAGDPCWPTMPNAAWTHPNGHSGVRGAELWWPAETNTSIRPGWFYHANEDTQVKDPQRLMKLFDESVARGTNLILNLPPDRRGRIPDIDLASLTAFGDALRASFARDLAQGAVATASAHRGTGFTPDKVLDGNRETYWSTPDADRTPSLILNLRPGTRFDLIRLRENLALGVRVTRFALDADLGSGWQEIANKEGIGAQRIIRLAQPIAPRRLRLRIVEAPACPAITEISLFRGVSPKPLSLARADGAAVLDRSRLKLVSASTPGAEILFDGGTQSPWVAEAPANLVIDLGGTEKIDGFVLTPLGDMGHPSGPPAAYVLEQSVDGQAWQRLQGGEFSNIANSRQAQQVRLPAAVRTRFLRFSFPRVATGAARLAFTELAILQAR